MELGGDEELASEFLERLSQSIADQVLSVPLAILRVDEHHAVKCMDVTGREEGGMQRIDSNAKKIPPLMSLPAGSRTPPYLSKWR